jgi:hypothetical protein
MDTILISLSGMLNKLTSILPCGVNSGHALILLLQPLQILPLLSLQGRLLRSRQVCQGLLRLVRQCGFWIPPHVLQYGAEVGRLPVGRDTVLHGVEHVPPEVLFHLGLEQAAGVLGRGVAGDVVEEQQQDKGAEAVDHVAGEPGVFFGSVVLVVEVDDDGELDEGAEPENCSRTAYARGLALLLPVVVGVVVGGIVIVEVVAVVVVVRYEGHPEGFPQPRGPAKHREREQPLDGEERRLKAVHVARDAADHARVRDSHPQDDGRQQAAELVQRHDHEDKDGKLADQRPRSRDVEAALELVRYHVAGTGEDQDVRCESGGCEEEAIEDVDGFRLKLPFVKEEIYDGEDVPSVSRRLGQVRIGLS